MCYVLCMGCMCCVLCVGCCVWRVWRALRLVCFLFLFCFSIFSIDFCSFWWFLLDFTSGAWGGLELDWNRTGVLKALDGALQAGSGQS
ncbi:hypothetical protein BJX70DRAFT_205220 [Aspergillus crustosus]